MAPETMEIPELYVVGDIVVKVFFALFCISPFALVAAIIIDGLCCIAASEQNPLPDIELGTHPPEPPPREPPQQHRSRHSQIWGPVVPYNPGITMQSGEIQICSICLEEFKVGDACRILFRCDHTYHQTCIDWLNRGNPDCPLCRCSVLQGRNPD